MSAAECPSPAYLVHVDEPRYLKLDCRRRRCVHCGPAHWKPYVQAKFFRGASRGERPLRVFALTAPGKLDGVEWWKDERAAAAWNLSVNDRFAAFFDELRRVFKSAAIDYWKVIEYQKRGLVHFHGVIAGLSWIEFDLLRRLAVKHGFGPRVEFHEPHGGLKRLCAYFTKYVLKNATDAAPATAPLRLHVVTSTHGWAPEWSSKRERTGPARWMWVPESAWWWAYGRAEFIASMGGDLDANRSESPPS